MVKPGQYTRYPTDLTKKQWKLIKFIFLRKKGGPGRPTSVNLRKVLNAILYLVRTGCQWRMLPTDYPKWTTVRYYYDKWTDNGTWQRINDFLRRMCRIQAGREPEPSMGLIDSQSAKTTEVGGIKGFDGGKHIKGRKRQVLTDTQGNLLGAAVHAANGSDQEGGADLCDSCLADLPSLKKILADQGYRGEPLRIELAEYDVVLEIVERPEDRKGFVVQAFRWVVERTIAWLNRYRRLSKDYEKHTWNSEAMLYIASIHLMLKRIESNTALPKLHTK
jgi:putative transposase